MPDHAESTELSKSKVNLKVKKLDPSALLPAFKTAGAVGADIAALEDTVLLPGETKLIRTGLALEISSGYYGMLAPRSSLAIRGTLSMPHSIGIIDSDYRDELLVALRNFGQEAVTLPAKERIAQLLILPHPIVTYEEADELSSTNRNGGFGSTGRI